MDEFYKHNILDHYRNPRNVGVLATPTHAHEEHNPLCGDVIKLELHVNNDEVIDEVAFKGKGCAISQASASMLTEMLEGRTLAEAKTINKDDILEALGLEIGPVRLKCALLSLKVLKMAAYGLKEEDWLTEDESW